LTRPRQRAVIARLLQPHGEARCVDHRLQDAENKAHDGTPYLMAHHLAERMAGATVDLGVDLLACTTRHWMRDETTLNLTAGGRRVSALAGFVGEIGAHVKGPKDCPMWHNPNRLLSHITGPQRFDAACRNKLKKQHTRELEAFDALLKAFV
jgi:hypothetical protein